MCGIAGILLFNKSYAALRNIRFMTNAMRHRGPDDEGFAFFNKNNQETYRFGGSDTPESVYQSTVKYCPDKSFANDLTDNNILALGHRRLSILDLSAAGHQPMCTEDERYWIVHNGEIYNFKDIREELKQCGESFISDTDTEVILKSYKVWGASCDMG